MRRISTFSLATILIQLAAATTFAQQGVEGRWTGSMQVPGASEMETTVTFKKDKDVYTGSILIAGMPEERPFKSVTVDGDTVRAQSEFAMPDGNIVVNFTFALKDDTLKGKGEADLGGQKMAFEINLKRARQDSNLRPPA
jgi:hypothetical protein